MSEVCGDNRFKLIGEFKGKLVEGTNIETSPEEMAVLDNILFRIWQMGWLDKLKAQEPRVMTLEEVKTLPSETDVWLDEFCSIIVAATISCTLYGNAYFYGIEHADYGVDHKLIDYGKEWRCWTSRPDNATREAVKWE